MDTVLDLVPYVVPPLVGAVIGYVTNALAIRMLFRPLTEKRVFGIRIPLTPGIIPRQRSQLAHSIARMVSTKLLTEDVLLSRLNDQAFGDVVVSSVGRFTSDILDGSPGESGGAEDATPESEVRGTIAEAAQGLLSSYFHSDAFSSVVHRVAETIAHGALEMRADQVLPQPERLAEL
ncbi:MAG: DUF445 domain-containing protein, partial [Spirochaetota bacterium]